MEEGRLPYYYSESLSLPYYSSDTLSSTTSSGSISSKSSSASYASIKSSSLSISSYTSRISENLKSLQFWNKFDRKPSKKRRSLNKVFTNLFKMKQSCDKTQNSIIQEVSTCPPGLYCVIDEFLTEYDLRLLEEEERADMLAKKSKTVKTE